MGKSLLILIKWIREKKIHEVQILEAYDLDNCVPHQCWKFEKIPLQPNGDIVFEIKYYWSVCLVVLRNTAKSFSLNPESVN